MAAVVITGSSRGIGRGLAMEFVKRGHHVALSGRSQPDLDRAVAELAKAGAGNVVGLACDVSRKAEVQALWDHAAGRFGRVDIWLNNAGRAVSRFAVRDTAEDLVHTMVDSNLKGTIFGSQVALAGFARQGGGALYNMLGGASGGKRLTPNMGVYSSTKIGDRLLTQYLVRENDNPDILIGMIVPGLLLSDNFFAEQRAMPPEEWNKFRRIMNILCDEVETAAPWLVEQVLANRRQGRLIQWQTDWQILGRFAAAFLLGRKRDVLTRHGL